MKRIFIILVLVVIVIVLAKDQIIKSVVVSQAKQIMGVRVDIGTLGIGLLRQEVRIKDLKVYNPAGFPDEVMVDIPEISLDFDLPAFLKGNLHVPMLVLHLKEMVVVRNKEGKLNVDALKVVEEKGSEKGKEEKQKQVGIQIDVATLNLGKVVVKDYTKGEPPSIQAYDIGVNKSFKNIKSAEQFVTLVLVQAMGPTALRNAAIYGAASVLGVAFLPAGIAGVILADDNANAEFNVSADKVYKVALEVIRKNGSVVKEDREQMKIRGKINGANVDVNVIKKDRNKTDLEVSARKYMMPKPEIANGIVYQITAALK